MSILSRRSGRDERADLYPAELLPIFNDRFVASYELFEEYVARQALAIFRSAGLEAACREETNVAAAMQRARLDPGIARVPVAWILNMVADRGWIARKCDPSGEMLFCVDRPLPALPPALIRQKQEEHDAACLPAYDIAELAAGHYPAVLRGETSGEQALFGPEGVLPWVKYFSNDNPIYGVSNTIGAIAAERALPPGEAYILEIGTGLGSGADALLHRLEARGRGSCSYLMTDVSPLFLKRALRTIASRHPATAVATATLDIDRPFGAQGIEPGRYSLAFGVNVLHVARDLAATLFELRRALREDGMLVMAECVRPFEGKAFHLELVFNLLASFRDAVRVPQWRPNGGFLTPEQWRLALESNGFREVQVYPDIETIRHAYPSFVSAALVARRS
jgi:SAM-dependent methyltransferase